MARRSAVLLIAWLACLGPGCTAAPAAAPSGVGQVSFQGGLDAGDAGADSAAKDGAGSGQDGAGPGADAAGWGKDGAAHDTPSADAPPADSTGADVAFVDSSDAAALPDVAVDSGPAGPWCGDGVCSTPETQDSCAVDCKPAVCGDGWCQDPESPPTCALDCDASAVAAFACVKAGCGSPVAACLAAPACASALDSAMSCLGECQSGPCDNCKTSLKMQGGSAGSAVANCGFSGCAGATPAQLCGDGECGAKESSTSCPYDCQGGSAAVCGDGTCSAGEPTTCPGDCKPGEVCGDGQCAAGESAATCPSDCKTAPYCGDATCQGSEDAAGCPFDCDPTVQPKTACGNQKCPSESVACFSDPGCAQILKDAYVCLAKCGSSSSACLSQCAGPVLGDDKAYALATCGQQNCP